MGRISLERQYSIENTHILKSRAPYPPPATGDRGAEAEGNSQHHHKNEGLWREGKFHSSPGPNPQGQCTARHACGWIHGCSPSQSWGGAALGATTDLEGQEAALHFCLALLSTAWDLPRTATQRELRQHHGSCEKPYLSIFSPVELLLSVV